MNAHHKAALAQPEHAPRLTDTQLRVVIPLPENATINDGEAPRLCNGKPAVAITMDRAQWRAFSMDVEGMLADGDNLLAPPKPATSATSAVKS